MNMSNIDDTKKLEHIVNQLGIFIDQAWTKMPSNQKSPSIPNNSRQRNVVALSITIEHQEVSKIGRNSRRQLKTSRDHFSTIKFKKLRTRVVVLGN